MTYATPSFPPVSNLFMVFKDEAGERGMYLKNLSYSIGRAQDCDIPLYSRHASRNHARITRIYFGDETNVRYVISDEGNLNETGSLNGTYINFEAIHVRTLTVGDRIQFGPTASATLETTEHLGVTRVAELLAAYEHSQAVAASDYSPSEGDTDLAPLPNLEPVIAEAQEEEIPSEFVTPLVA